MKKMVLLFLFLSPISALAQNQYNEVLKSLSGYREHQAARFSKSNLEEILKQSQPKKISELLKLLPNKGFKDNAIIIFKSRSLQASSAQHPRILLYNNDGSLIITFNGHPSQEGFEALEVMSFDFSTLKFHFEEVVFKDDLSQRLKYHPRAIDRTNREGINPPSCLACHRSPEPRPNWGVYPLWPGVISQEEGSVERIVKDFNSDRYVPNKEWVSFKTFLTNAKKNERYKHLTINYNFWINKVNEVEAKNSLIEKSVYTSSTVDSLLNRSAELTGLLTRLNFLRLSKDLVCHKDFKIYKNLLLEALSIDKSSRASIASISRQLQIPIDKLNEEVLKIMTLQSQSDELFNNQINYFAGGNQTQYRRSSFGKNKNLALLAVIMQRKLNLNLSAYELSFESGNYNFSAPDSSDAHLATGITLMENIKPCF